MRPLPGCNVRKNVLNLTNEDFSQVAAPMLGPL